MTKNVPNKINVIDLVGNFSIALEQLEGENTKTLIFERSDCDLRLELKSIDEEEHKIIDLYEVLCDMVYGRSNARHASVVYGSAVYLFRNNQKEKK